MFWELGPDGKLSHKLSSLGSPLSTVLLPQVHSCCKVLETWSRGGKEFFLTLLVSLAGSEN